MTEKPYSDIPGTYVFDSDHARKGFHLNMFMMTLLKPENRERFREDEAAYLDDHKLTPEQRKAVLDRDWLGMLKYGGNIYYTAKLAAADGKPFEALFADMAGMERPEYRKMMIAGGRPIDGNRTKAEWAEQGKQG